MKREEHWALLRAAAQEAEPRVPHRCGMGVGCEEAGLCYASAHGQPDMCGMPDDPPIDAPDSKR